MMIKMAAVHLFSSLCIFLSVFLSVSTEFASVIRGDALGTFKIINTREDNFLAVANFTNSINSTGWAVLDVETNADVDDFTQAYAAGLLEGHLTKDLVNMHWHNTAEGYCQSPFSAYCLRLKAFLQTNLMWMYQKIATSPKSAYWHQVATQLVQINGLSDGVSGVPGRPRVQIDDIFGLYLMHIMAGDTEDLEPALHKNNLKPVTGSGSCSALIKLLPGFQELFVSQDTWNSYQSMLRIIKRYNFNFRQTADPQSPPVPARSISFSGYPGTIWSGDDFYTLSSGLVALETTNGNNNDSLWSLIRPTDSVLENFRVTIANRLSTNINDWGELFSVFNSGTYNNQWMIVDYKKFVPGKMPESKGLLLVLEQMPGIIVKEDKTTQLLQDTFWSSFNIPAFPEIFAVAGYWPMVQKYGDWFTHDKAPRALIFKRDHHKVRDMASMLRMMRYNDFHNDPLSICANCTPHQNAENAISARSDLNPANGTYAFGALGHRSHGGTDCKVTTSQLVASQSFVAVSGPTWDDLPPFKWSTADFAADTPHVGHPDQFKFQPVLINWQGDGFVRPLAKQYGDQKIRSSKSDHFQKL